MDLHLRFLLLQVHLYVLVLVHLFDLALAQIQLFDLAQIDLVEPLLTLDFLVLLCLLLGMVSLPLEKMFVILQKREKFIGLTLKLSQVPKNLLQKLKAEKI